MLFSYSCAISQGGRRALGRLAWEVGDVGGKWVTDVRVVIDSGDLWDRVGLGWSAPRQILSGCGDLAFTDRKQTANSSFC